MRLADKVAIVTGGGDGIGRGIALCLAKEGADVAITDINTDAMNRTVKDIEALGRRGLALEADATSKEAVTAAVEKVIATFGKIDILVNNVGGMKGDIALINNPDMWDGVYELTMKSHVIACQAVLPHLVKQRSGKIINISSVAAWMPIPPLKAYAAMKSAVVSYTRSLALEAAGSNINVNCICPGVIWTKLWERLAIAMMGMNPSAEKMSPREYFERNIAPNSPLGREETSEDVGRAVVFFASDDARNITGQSLNIDGGSRMN